ncbi:MULTISPECIES: disulfide bond formation protein B [unclassified Mesorhizobium]|jgi:disulfide bond formation protein DsbB|uniref:disulfide bond formation protein B n=1 Tax=unclassified Mesorhizobium TaxID=325217 RepID=UPI0008ED2254|nr:MULTISPECIES: disulfide bond formation protein B [unclassified Mesorhizobium]RJG43880.1 disulfide bond formation protein B [Mesorhizobium sp. DCY119]SFT49261.1 Disulfide bond formation protein DsbB [Mesorhizobium sp. YR577]
MSRTLTQPTSSVQTATALILLVGMAAVVGSALGFEHLGGYMPCKLCLEQRTPYYVGVPLMAIAALSSALHLPAVITRGLLLIGGLLMAYGLYLGVFHSGVEWAWWAGPTDCGAVSAPATGGTGGVLDSLNTVIPPSCDKAALRILGLSLAGWNAIASLILTIIAFRGATGKA